jgi:Nitrile hydratase beta subunit, C-terminal
MTARFKAGDAVRIRDANPPGHCRVPVYARGREGVIERVCGAFANPQELAYGFDGLPKRPLYRVRIRQTDIWPDYKGSDKDFLELEIMEHWLEPA